MNEEIKEEVAIVKEEKTKSSATSKPKKKTTKKKTSAASSKSGTKSTKKKEPVITPEPVSKEDLEINNDLYNLYITNYSNKKDERASIDIFEAIDDELENIDEIIEPNTSGEKPGENQLDFASEVGAKNLFGDNADFEDEDGDEESNEPDEESELPVYNEKKPRRIDGGFDFLELFIFTLVAVVILTSFIFKHSIVEGSSMENTLVDGEHLIISDVFYTPKQNDIIVCEDYGTGLNKPIVKRVIAVGGDKLSITPDGKIYVNDELLEENYVFTDGKPHYPELSMIVPEGEIYVMGDHRNASSDSRDFGCIDEDSVLGRVLLRFFPFDKFGVID